MQLQTIEIQVAYLSALWNAPNALPYSGAPAQRHTDLTTDLLPPTGRAVIDIDWVDLLSHKLL